MDDFFDYLDNFDEEPPDNGDIYQQARRYLTTRAFLLRDYEQSNTENRHDIQWILDELTEAFKTVSRLTILTKELYAFLLYTEPLFTQHGRASDWNLALVSLLNAVMTKLEGKSSDFDEIDEQLLEEMLLRLYERSGAMHLSTGKLGQAKLMLKTAIDYGLDMSATDPKKATLWLKANVIYLEANIRNMPLNELDEQCRTLMMLNEQQQSPSQYIKALIYLLLAAAHRHHGNWPEAFAYGQTAISIGYQFDYDSIVMSAITEILEYVVSLKQKTLLDTYILLWDYYQDLWTKSGRPQNFDLQAHYNAILAVVRYSEQKFDESFNHYQTASQFFKERKDIRNIGLMTHGQGLAAAKMKEFDTADSLYRVAAKNYRRIGIISKEVQVMYARVRAWEANNRYKAAYRGYLRVRLRLLNLPANDFRQNMLDMIDRDLDNLRPHLSNS